MTIDSAFPAGRHAPRPLVSVVLPCLNEAESVALCVREALDVMRGAGLPGEVVVVDNGSTDGSPAIAEAAGARIVFEGRKGYGSALRAGIREARGEVVVMADADFTYDFAKIPALAGPVLTDKADLVLGCRLRGATRRSMPFLHRFAGTPTLTFLVRKACGGLSIRDSQSGFRAFRRLSVLELGLESTGMEFASEMLIRASHAGLRISEIETGYRERIGDSKLQTFPDGWRHLQLILMLAPHIVLVGPGALLTALGLALTVLAFVAPGGVSIGSLHWQPIFFSAITLVLGTQALLVGALAAFHSPVVVPHVKEKFRAVGTHRFAAWCMRAGLAAFATGIAIDLALFGVWVRGTGAPPRGLALASLAQSFIVIGGPLAGFGFFRRLSIRGVAGDRLAVPAARPAPAEAATINASESFATDAGESRA